MNKKIVDVCCGSKMMWFDKKDPRVLYLDNRRETHNIDIGTPGTKGRKPIVVDPDQIEDFTNLPFQDNCFKLVVFDPPHLRRKEAKGIITKKYGHLTEGWEYMLKKGFQECFRILEKDGILIFKWAETEVSVSKILTLTKNRPLFGHKSGKSAKTHWITFIKDN